MPSHRRPASSGLLVIHSSDVHVDDDYTARLHSGDGAAGLHAVLATAHALSAHLVILAGDTFENNRLPRPLLDRAAALLAACAMPVVILPGNHDPLTPGSVFDRGRLLGLPGVHVLGAEDDAIAFADLDLEVWGRAHRDYEDMAPLAAPPRRRARWHVAVAHGHYEAKPDRSTPYRPSWLIGADELTATAADYVALGHWNRPARVGAAAARAHYSGAPEYAGTVNAVRLAADGRVGVIRAPIRWPGGRPSILP